MKLRGFWGRRRFLPGGPFAFALMLPMAGSVRADLPLVTLGPDSVKIQAAAASLTEIIDALARAASFQVSYEGPRPSAMLFNAEIESPSIPRALFRLLDGQNLNFAVVLDPSGGKVASVMILGVAPKGRVAATSGSTNPEPQAFPTPLRSRRPARGNPAPVEEEVPENEETVEQEEPAGRAEPAEPTAPPPAVPADVGMPAPPSPFAPRSPFGSPFGPPFGPRPLPSPKPSPSA